MKCGQTFLLSFFSLCWVGLISNAIWYCVLLKWSIEHQSECLNKMHDGKGGCVNSREPIPMTLTPEQVQKQRELIKQTHGYTRKVDEPSQTKKAAEHSPNTVSRPHTPAEKTTQPAAKEVKTSPPTVKKTKLVPSRRPETKSQLEVTKEVPPETHKVTQETHKKSEELHSTTKAKEERTEPPADALSKTSTPEEQKKAAVIPQSTPAPEPTPASESTPAPEPTPALESKGLSTEARLPDTSEVEKEAARRKQEDEDRLALQKKQELEQAQKKEKEKEQLLEQQAKEKLLQEEKSKVSEPDPDEGTEDGVDDPDAIDDLTDEIPNGLDDSFEI